MHIKIFFICCLVVSVCLPNRLWATDKKELRTAKKEQARMQRALEFERAMAAMEGRSFVFQADYVTLQKSSSYVATQTDTFISVEGETIIIQIDAPQQSYDPYGTVRNNQMHHYLSGTISGKISKIEPKRNKRGDFIYEIYYNVSNFTYQLPIYLVKGGNKANCQIEGKARMSGRILLPSQSPHYRGHYTPQIPTGMEF